MTSWWLTGYWCGPSPTQPSLGSACAGPSAGITFSHSLPIKILFLFLSLAQLLPPVSENMTCPPQLQSLSCRAYHTGPGVKSWLLTHLSSPLGCGFESLVDLGLLESLREGWHGVGVEESVLN